jgi:hypothetical protein
MDWVNVQTQQICNPTPEEIQTNKRYSCHGNAVLDACYDAVHVGFFQRQNATTHTSTISPKIGNNKRNAQARDIPTLLSKTKTGISGRSATIKLGINSATSGGSISIHPNNVFTSGIFSSVDFFLLVLRRCLASSNAFPKGCPTSSADGFIEREAEIIPLAPSLRPFCPWPA